MRYALKGVLNQPIKVRNKTASDKLRYALKGVLNQQDLNICSKKEKNKEKKVAIRLKRRFESTGLVSAEEIEDAKVAIRLKRRFESTLISS